MQRNPVTDVNSAQFRCYTNGNQGAPQTLTIAAGSTLTYNTGMSICVELKNITDSRSFLLY